MVYGNTVTFCAVDTTPVRWTQPTLGAERSKNRGYQPNFSGSDWQTRAHRYSLLMILRIGAI